jgi:hypothetical protein
VARSLAILALLLAVPTAASAETLREQSRRSVEIPGISKVLAQNARGRVEVRPSRDRSLHVTALKIVRAADRRTARNLAADTIVELGRDGARYNIRVRYPRIHSRVSLWEGIGEMTIPRVEVRLALEIPSGVAIELNGSSADMLGESVGAPLTMKSASGDAEVRACTGQVQVSTASGDVVVEGSRKAWIHTVSGDIRVEKTRGPLRLQSTSGDVDVADLGDSLDIDTVSGDISVGNAPAGATLDTSSGGIDLHHASGRIHAKTVSGDVKAMLEHPLRGAEIATSTGEIGVGLAEAVGCTLEMRTSSGSIALEVPCKTQTLTRQVVTAVVRQGTAPVLLRSVSGNITVTRGEP